MWYAWKTPKRLFYSQLKIGERPRNKPKKRFKDCDKGNLKLLEIDVDSWEVLAGNRNKLKRFVKAGCNSLEMKRLKYMLSSSGTIKKDNPWCAWRLE